jgi:hypothetical protein
MGIFLLKIKIIRYLETIRIGAFKRHQQITQNLIFSKRINCYFKYNSIFVYKIHLEKNFNFFVVLISVTISAQKVDLDRFYFDVSYHALKSLCL